MKFRGRPAIAYTILVVAIAIVIAIIAHDVNTSEKAARQARDFALAFEYKDQHDAMRECVRDNNAALARIASAEAIVSISAHANPNLNQTLEERLLLIAYIKKVNAAIVRNNPLKKCSLPALGLPKLPPLTPGAKIILRRADKNGAEMPNEVKATTTTRPRVRLRLRTTTTTTRPGHRNGHGHKRPKG